MKTVVVHHDYDHLPPAKDGLVPVRIYGLDEENRGDIATIGNPIIDKIKRLGVKVSQESFDFMTISLAVTAADTFVRREEAADGWAREISLNVALGNPAPWLLFREKLEKSLHFLSGDIWKLRFTDGGYDSPEPYTKKNRYKITPLQGLDCVSLFSGGLDSAIGAIDLLENKRRPLLVSHAYSGDGEHQEWVARKLRGNFSRFYVNADPERSTNMKNSHRLTDVTMRTRSINFLAFAAVGADAVSQVNQIDCIDLFVPENGFISINAPLVPRRIGSLSTRTTHPHFLGMMQSMFEFVGIQSVIVNPYKYQTKGEMCINCLNMDLLKEVTSDTVSCSHWKRHRSLKSKKQCGVCVPCIIRRAALCKSSILEKSSYQNVNLKRYLSIEDTKDDLIAVMQAISSISKKNPKTWISESGPLPLDGVTRQRYADMFVRGIQELESFLRNEGVVK